MRILRKHSGRRAVVQVGEQSLDGTIDTADREAITLTQARLLTMQDAMPLDGSVVIPVAAVRWAQVA